MLSPTIQQCHSKLTICQSKKEITVLHSFHIKVISIPLSANDESPERTVDVICVLVEWNLAR